MIGPCSWNRDTKRNVVPASTSGDAASTMAISIFVNGPATFNRSRGD